MAILRTEAKQMTRQFNIKKPDPAFHIRAAGQLQSRFHGRLIARFLRSLAVTPVVLLRRIGRALVRGRRRRQSLRELRELNDRTLKDIGLTRGELNAVADYYADNSRFPRGETSSYTRGAERR